MNPEPTKGYVGDSAVLSVIAFTSNGMAPKFRWKKDDVLIPDQTASDLTIYDLKPSDAGKYKVEIESDDGNPATKETVLETQEILLEVIAAPLMPVAPSVSTIRGSTSIASNSRGLLAISVDGYPKPSITWFKDGTPLSGEAGPNLLFDKSVENLKAVEGIYHAEASNSAGIARSESFAVIVDKTSVVPQLVRSSLLTQRIALGSRLTLEADVAAYPNARFQWQKDGIVVPGESRASFSRDNVTTAASGLYRLTSSNSAGAIATEFNVTVVDTIRITTPLSNQMVPQGQSTTLQVVFAGDVERIEWFKDGVLIPNANGTNLNLGNVSTSASGVYLARASNISGAVDTMATLTVVGPPVFTNALPANLSFAEIDPVTLTVDAVGTGLTYRWYKNNVLLVGANMNRLTLGPATFLDIANYRVEVINLGGQISTQSNVSVSLVTDGGSIYARDCAGCHGALANTQRVNRTAAQIENAILTIPAMQGRLLKSGLVRLSPNQLANLESALRFEPPVITSTPLSILKVYASQPARFSVSASGASLSYQWLKDGVAISGATSSTYTIPAAITFDKGSYSVRVTNPGGSVTSGSTLLDVMGVPLVTTDLANRSMNEDEALRFTVSNVTSDDFTWTWHRDSTLLKSGDKSGFDQMQLEIKNITVNDSGTYKLTVTNPAGSFVKSAVVTVAEVPLVVVTPLPAKIVSHCSETINIAATISGGNSAKKYEWLGGLGSNDTNTYSVYNGNCTSLKLTLRVTSGTQVIELKTELVRSFFKTINGVTSFAPNADSMTPVPDIKIADLRSVFYDPAVAVYSDGDDCAFVINGYNPPKLATTKCNGGSIRVVDTAQRWITDGTNIMSVYTDSVGAKIGKISHPNIDHATVRKVGNVHLADSKSAYYASITGTSVATELVGSDGPSFTAIGTPGSNCSKDKSRVYCEATVLPLVPDQTKLLGNTISDAIKVYFLSNPPSLLANLVGANVVSDGFHTWDLVNVYHNRDQIVGALPASFRPIDSVNERGRTMFSKDAARAYFQEKPIANADPSTFIVRTYNATDLNNASVYMAEDAVATYACPFNSNCTRTLK